MEEGREIGVHITLLHNGGVFQLVKIKVFTINNGFRLFTLLLQRSLKPLYVVLHYVTLLHNYITVFYIASHCVTSTVCIELQVL